MTRGLETMLADPVSPVNEIACSLLKIGKRGDKRACAEERKNL